MTKTSDMLIELNKLHAKLDRKPFKAWKQSRDKLTAAIMKAQAEVNAKEPPVVSVPKPDQEMRDLIGIANRYRNAIGKTSLTTWSGTHDELRSAIATWKQTDTDAREAEKKAKPVKVAKKAKKAVVVTKKSKDDAILPRIARDLRMEPKVARTRLRKKFGSDWKNLTEKEIRAALTKK
jgi:hypothetical protein